jgi:uroporphyrinogen-III synthase
MSTELADYSVLVTRPAHQADSFSRRVEQAGGVAIRLPTIKICPAKGRSTLLQNPQYLKAFDFAIFVSANAVDWVFSQLRKNALPESLQCVAVGKKTLLALECHDQSVVVTPKAGYTSESLLAQPELQSMQNKKVVIFRGEGGRELLAKTLRERGAVVKYVEVYRRCLPEYTDEQIRAIVQGMPVSVVMITSSESLNNLVTLFSRIDKSYLLNLPLILGSDRMLEMARQLGFKNFPVIAPDPSDGSMLQALLAWAKSG